MTADERKANEDYQQRHERALLLLLYKKHRDWLRDQLAKKRLQKRTE